jgi:RsmE family RNA methyltransferase
LHRILLPRCNGIVNIVLFAPDELSRPLPMDDPRARHVLHVLGCRRNDRFHVGVPNGPRGKARIVGISATELRLEFELHEPPDTLHPLDLLVGLCRPAECKRILRDAASLGVRTMHFVQAEKSERSYRHAALWHEGAYETYLLRGAEQAFVTTTPTVSLHDGLEAALSTLPAGERLVALDNYEATEPLSSAASGAKAIALAVGPERGWSPRERTILRERGAILAHLGPRVLRTETAMVLATGLSLAVMGLLSSAGD